MVLLGKNLPANAGNLRDASLIPGLGRPWRMAWQPTAVFIPEESHGEEDPGRLQANSWAQLR